MGVNLPATHVLIRDHNFWGRGHLPISDILQMLGRAGRGDMHGTGELLIDDEKIAESYAERLRARILPPIEPKMFGFADQERWRPNGNALETEDGTIQTLALSEIVAQGRGSVAQIEGFLQMTFSGFLRCVPSSIRQNLQYLQQWHLIQKVEGSEDFYEPRVLGKTTCLTGIHPQTAASLGGFLVALIRLSEREKERDPAKEGNYLRRLNDLDLLFITCASLDASPEARG
jgi:helicase